MNKTVERFFLEKKPCSELKGVGPETTRRLAQAGIHTIADCLFYLPTDYQDRSHIVPIARCHFGKFVVIEGEVIRQNVTLGKRRVLHCWLRDESGEIELRFFYFNASQREKLSIGTRVRCYGEVRGFRAQLQLVHPEYEILSPTSFKPLPTHLTPVYSTPVGLPQPRWRAILQQCLALLRADIALVDYLPPALCEKFKLWSLREALLYIHEPPVEALLTVARIQEHPAYLRLVIEELLAQQLCLRRIRGVVRAQKAPVLAKNPQAAQQFQNRLPFELTAAQQKVISEISADIASATPMMRLLQGDVGSGKTVVAALAMFQAVQAGTQAVLMVPTELLAEQHFKNFTQWFLPFGIICDFLTGRSTGAARNDVLTRLANGQSQIIVGTHALFQEAVAFHHLGLVVIDEQHRFGVQQRLALINKESHQSPHQLVMTATPIPRTLMMTAYADLDVSVLNERPIGRQPIQTIVLSHQKRAELIERVQQVCAEGHLVYWVCTLIEESEALQSKAALLVLAELQKAMPHVAIGLVHGRLKAEEKEQIMQQFKAGVLQILVATTVVEVGVDVPHATLMVIENAGRLGLAQLHQLRGRVGRGEAQSHCVLLYETPLSAMAKKRLQVIREYQDGFIIAEKDLELRGPGEILGTRQAGMLAFKIAHVIRDQALLPQVAALAMALEHQPQAVDGLIRRWVSSADYYKA